VPAFRYCEEASADVAISVFVYYPILESFHGFNVQQYTVIPAEAGIQKILDVSNPDNSRVNSFSVLEFLKNVFCQVILDLPVTRNWLKDAGTRILVPIVQSAVPDENTPEPLNLPDQIKPFHAI
jgi:hypothetical protein